MTVASLLLTPCCVILKSECSLLCGRQREKRQLNAWRGLLMTLSLQVNVRSSRSIILDNHIGEIAICIRLYHNIVWYLSEFNRGSYNHRVPQTNPWCRGTHKLSSIGGTFLSSLKKALKFWHSDSGPFCCVMQDFRNGKVDTAFIPKHEQELAEVSENFVSLL